MKVSDNPNQIKKKRMKLETQPRAEETTVPSFMRWPTQSGDAIDAGGSRMFGAHKTSPAKHPDAGAEVMN